jgi:hypothetical protein
LIAVLDIVQECGAGRGQTKRPARRSARKRGEKGDALFFSSFSDLQ